MKKGEPKGLTFAPPRPELSGSAKETGELHEKLKPLCKLIADRCEMSHGGTCGGPVVLSKSLGLRSFVAEFVFDAKQTPILLFVRHVVLRPVGNHHRRQNAWKTARSFVRKKDGKSVGERFSEFLRGKAKEDEAARRSAANGADAAPETADSDKDDASTRSPERATLDPQPPPGVRANGTLRQSDAGVQRSASNVARERERERERERAQLRRD